MGTPTIDQEREHRATTGPPAVPAGGDRFVGTSLFVLAGSLLLLQVLAGELLPGVAVPAVLYVALAVALLRRRRRWLLVTAVVLPVVHLAASLPFLSASLTSPESPATFVPDAITVVAAVTALLGAALALRREHVDRRPAAVAGMGLGAVAIVASLAVAAGVESDVRRDGDVAVVAADVRFPTQVAVPAGTSTLWVDNRDPIHHTLVVEEAGIHVELPGRSAVRVPVDVAPGTYPFLCDVPGHEEMRGEFVAG